MSPVNRGDDMDIFDQQQKNSKLARRILSSKLLLAAWVSCKSAKGDGRLKGAISDAGLLSFHSSRQQQKTLSAHLLEDCSVLGILESSTQ